MLLGEGVARVEGLPGRDVQLVYNLLEFVIVGASVMQDEVCAGPVCALQVRPCCFFGLKFGGLLALASCLSCQTGFGRVEQVTPCCRAGRLLGRVLHGYLHAACRGRLALGLRHEAAFPHVPVAR